MLQEQLAPSLIAKPLEMRGRVYDIGAQHRGEYAISMRWCRIKPRAREFDCLERLVAGHGRVMTRRNVIDIVDAELAHLASVTLHPQPST
jgi:hypothetical protein